MTSLRSVEGRPLTRTTVNQPSGGAVTQQRTDTSELANMNKVDVHPDVHRATEADEEQVLRELYGAPDSDGIYRGEGV